MAHDVFVSHSVKEEDQKAADTVYDYLKSNGINCFMDKKDLIPGMAFPKQLAEAIRESRIVVLVFSSNADTSEAVLAEMTIASNFKKSIIPLRIENTLPQGLVFFLATPQWLDAFPPPLEKHLPKLVGAIKKHFSIAQAEDEMPKQPDQSLHGSAKILDTGWVTDYEWHDVAYSDLSQWVKGRDKELRSGKIVRGRTFLWRFNRHTLRYQKKLK
jgi:hypothetical protein